MSQTFTDDLYEQSIIADTTLTNMENNFAALKSSFSGGVAPSNPVPFMLWGDTTGSGKSQKIRNDGDTAWLALLMGDANQKMWIYRNDSCQGWVIDATVTDRVLAVKGGSNAYNVNGGNIAGTWTQPGHALVANEIPVHTHVLGSAGSHTHSIGIADSSSGTISVAGSPYTQSNSLATASAGNHSHTIANTGGGASHNHGDTHRPAAAVGTLQYPDL